MPTHPFSTAATNFHAQLGAELLEWRDGLVRVVVTLAPQHLNLAGIVHGGVLLSVLDEVGALCGLWSDTPDRQRHSVTVDLAGHFTGQAREGRIYGTGELVSQGRSLYFSRAEIRDANGAVLAFGTSTHKWRRGSETVDGVAQAQAS